MESSSPTHHAFSGFTGIEDCDVSLNAAQCEPQHWNLLGVDFYVAGY
jgi:hypothetical protein